MRASQANRPVLGRTRTWVWPGGAESAPPRIAPHCGTRPVILVIKTGASPSLPHPRSIDRAITAAIAIATHVSAPLPHSLAKACWLLQRVISAARARLNRRMGICQNLGGHTFRQAVFWFGPFEFCNSVAEQGDRVIHQLSDQASSLKGQLQ